MSRRLAFLPLVAVACMAAPVVARADDTSAAKDWKEQKAKGNAKTAKERAEFWAPKVSGKDLFWLGLLWNKARDFDKAIESFEKYLACPETNAADISDATRTNRESARKTIVTAYMEKKDYAKVITAAEEVLKEFPNSRDVAAMRDEQGRAHRLLGDQDKALAAFGQAADLHYGHGVLDAADMLMAEGKIAEAKAVIAKYSGDEELKKREKLISMLGAFLEKIGTPAPSIEKAANVGPGVPFSTWIGQPTVLYFWAMTMANADRRLGRVQQLGKAYDGTANVVAIATTNRWDPRTSKKDETLTAEAEIDLYKQFLEDAQTRVPMPRALVVEQSVLDGLMLSQEGHKVIVDADGKLRYMRITDDGQKAYDWLCVDLALKKILANPTTR